MWPGRPLARLVIKTMPDQTLSDIDEAVVLAAGRGRRMGALTETLPKPLIPVAGRPMLHHILAGMAAAGVRRAHVVVGYQGAGRRILVADDKPLNRSVLRDMLEPLGFELFIDGAPICDGRLTGESAPTAAQVRNSTNTAAPRTCSTLCLIVCAPIRMCILSITDTQCISRTCVPVDLRAGETAYL